MSRIGSRSGCRAQGRGDSKTKTSDFLSVPCTQHPVPGKGFMLVEAMVAAAVLSLGVVMLYRSFFSSLDAVQYASHRIFAQIWIQGKIAAERENVILLGEVVPGTEAASFVLEGREFSWHRTLQSLDADLYMLSITLSWKDAARTRTESYTTYLNNP